MVPFGRMINQIDIKVPICRPVFCKGFDLGIDKPSAGCLFERLDRRAIGFFQQVQFVCTEPKRKEPCEGIGSGVPVFCRPQWGRYPVQALWVVVGGYLDQVTSRIRIEDCLCEFLGRFQAILEIEQFLSGVCCGSQ